MAQFLVDKTTAVALMAATIYTEHLHFFDADRAPKIAVKDAMRLYELVEAEVLKQETLP